VLTLDYALKKSSNMIPVRALLYIDIELEETIDIRASKVQTDSSYAATTWRTISLAAAVGWDGV